MSGPAACGTSLARPGSMPSPAARLASILLAAGLSSTFVAVATRSRAELDLPGRMLWAWERPEDLRTLTEGGVAFLASTVRLVGSESHVLSRRQPLRVSATTPVAAVVRVETEKPALSVDQRRKTVRAIVAASRQPRVRAIQVDFDARASERTFYRSVVHDVRRALLPGIGFSITALASWCLFDGWIEGLPVDEAVPMLFDMGADSAEVKARLRAGRDFRLSVCRTSYGLSIAEPIEGLRGGRRIYWWSPAAWTTETQGQTRRTR